MSIFTKYIKQFQNARTAFVNGDAALAAVGSMLYVAKAGGISDKEFDAVIDMMRSNPRFEGLDIDSMVAKWEGYASERMARRDLFDLLSKIKGECDIKLLQDVVISVIEVADADGEEDDCECQDNISPAEKERIDEIGNAVGVDVDKLI